MLKFEDFEVLTFDCYGTLIDWESGLLKSLSTRLSTHQVNLGKDELLRLYGELETAEESGEYLTYREVMKNALRKIGASRGFRLSLDELDSFPESIKDWLPFSDTVAALKSLKNRYKLAIISNIDDDLFAYSAKHLEVEFDNLITAQQVKSYKPSLNNFTRAIEIIGLPKAKILHVAQSLYHDIAPAKTSGLANVWINRRHDQSGFGATPACEATPDLSFPDLESFAKAALRE